MSGPFSIIGCDLIFKMILHDSALNNQFILSVSSISGHLSQNQLTDEVIESMSLVGQI